MIVIKIFNFELKSLSKKTKDKQTKNFVRSIEDVNEMEEAWGVVSSNKLAKMHRQANFEETFAPKPKLF